MRLRVRGDESEMELYFVFGQQERGSKVDGNQINTARMVTMLFNAIMCVVSLLPILSFIL